MPNSVPLEDAQILARAILEDPYEFDDGGCSIGSYYGYECRYCWRRCGATVPTEVRLSGHDLDCPLLVAADIMTQGGGS